MASPLTSLKPNRRVQQLSQATFPAFIASCPTVIVHLGPRSSPSEFLGEVIQHFAADRGDQVAFGSLDTLTIFYDPWALRFVGKLFSAPLRAAPAGYYLFVAGTALAFHPEVVSSTSHQDLWILGLAGIVSLAVQSPLPLSTVGGGISQRNAKAVIAYFEEAMKPRAAPKPPVDWGKIFSAAPKQDDPYKELGIHATATDDEVHKAYRMQAKMTHPDQVAHLSPEIQKFVNDRFVAVKAAYDKIVAMRRKTP